MKFLACRDPGMLSNVKQFHIKCKNNSNSNRMDPSNPHATYVLKHRHTHTDRQTATRTHTHTHIDQEAKIFGK